MKYTIVQSWWLNITGKRVTMRYNGGNTTVTIKKRRVINQATLLNV